MEHARQQLLQVPGLLHRMANLMGIEFHGELPSEEVVALVLEEMWKFNQTYQLAHGVSHCSIGEQLMFPIKRGDPGARPAFGVHCRWVLTSPEACPATCHPAHWLLMIQFGAASSQQPSWAHLIRKPTTST